MGNLIQKMSNKGLTKSELDSTHNELNKGISHFASDMYQQCVKSASGNMIISPFSVASTLVLLSQAADGNTLDELKKGLHLNEDKSKIAEEFHGYYELFQNGVGEATLSVVNQIYVQQEYEIKGDFQEMAVQKFGAGVEPVNFVNQADTIEKINRFVEEKTNGMIKEVFQPDSLKPDTRVVLVNAIHFKCNWAHQFLDMETEKGDFDISGTKTVKADFMYMGDTYFHIVKLPDLKATTLKLEFYKSDFSMVFVLPNGRTGLKAMEKKLINYDFASITKKMQMRKVLIWIPKFTDAFEINLNEALKNMGMGEMFTDYANFSGLLEKGEPLEVSDVIHKAVINVNEGGVEAAATTTVRVIPYCLIKSRKLIPKYRVDHPFRYYIWNEKSKTVVFSGRVTNFK